MNTFRISESFYNSLTKGQKESLSYMLRSNNTSTLKTFFRKAVLLILSLPVQAEEKVEYRQNLSVIINGVNYIYSEDRREFIQISS